jgi:hypothetical protein
MMFQTQAFISQREKALALREVGQSRRRAIVKGPVGIGA